MQVTREFATHSATAGNVASKAEGVATRRIIVARRGGVAYRQYFKDAQLLLAAYAYPEMTRLFSCR